jgi:hypothetical protein
MIILIMVLHRILHYTFLMFSYLYHSCMIVFKLDNFDLTDSNVLTNGLGEQMCAVWVEFTTYKADQHMY